MKYNPDLALKYLERKRKNEFSLKTENESNVNLNLKNNEAKNFLNNLNKTKNDNV
jgi:hypothetical protein